MSAVTLAALAFLPGVAAFAARLAFTTWRTTRRRRARGAWRQIVSVRPYAATRGEV